MIIVNRNGIVPHAWLDGTLIDPSCAGLRCRLLIGDEGGVVCDMVVPADGRAASPSTADEAALVATHAVLNTDPRTPDPLPVTDDAGEPARIVPDGEVPQGVPAPSWLSASSTLPPTSSRAPSRSRTFLTRAAGNAGLALVSAFAALSSGAEDGLGAGILLVASGFATSSAFKWVSKARQEASDHQRRMAQTIGVARERERRSRLPECIGF